ncbi:uncharacterized protein [Miscanthus floridulus]|uniref:uncharacterized protein n=1 Tax=Miscanthus floridulus TaxID=154761 RepID=UPI00345A73B5
MRLRVHPLANRLVRMARRVISGQANPASLTELLPAEAVELGNLMEAYYIPVDQGPPPRIDIHSLAGLITSLNTTDGRAEVVVHAVASLTEAHAAAASARDRGWIVTSLPDLAQLAALAVEVDRLTDDLLPRVVADPSTTRDVFALKNAASTVRNQARRLDSAGEFRLHLDRLMNRILGEVRQVISGQAAPPHLADVLPAARDGGGGVDDHLRTPIGGVQGRDEPGEAVDVDARRRAWSTGM